MGHEIAGFCHALMAKIGRIGEHRRQDSAGFIGNPTALQMREALAETGPSIDFSKEIGDADRGQMGVERRKGAIRFIRRDRLQRRNPQLAKAELYVFQRVRLRLPLDLCQSPGETGTPFVQPGTGRIGCRDRQRAGCAHGGKYRTWNKLLLDGTIASASLDPHVAGTKPVTKLD